MYTFEPDSNVQQVAEAYYLDALDAAREGWGIELDGTEGSIQFVEQSMLSQLHDTMEAAQPSEELLDGFVKMFGSYVGEVYRRHHGAEWGWVTSGEDRFVGLRRNASGGLCWPWGRVQQRVLNGSEHNVWHYYVMLLQSDGLRADTASPAARKPDSILGRLFGRD